MTIDDLAELALIEATSLEQNEYKIIMARNLLKPTGEPDDRKRVKSGSGEGVYKSTA